MTSSLKYLNYADDICLLTRRVLGLNQMAMDLENEASRVGLKLNTHKMEALSLRGLSTCINGERTISVDQFIYLENVISADGALFQIWKFSCLTIKITVTHERMFGPTMPIKTK